jgi:hypothetical protein
MYRFTCILRDSIMPVSHGVLGYTIPVSHGVLGYTIPVSHGVLGYIVPVSHGVPVSGSRGYFGISDKISAIMIN